MHSEEHKDLLDVAFNMLRLLTNNVETDSLCKGTALANSDDISRAKAESWRAVSSDSLVTLFKTAVLGDKVKVVASDDNSVLHFGGNHDTPK